MHALVLAASTPLLEMPLLGSAAITLPLRQGKTTKTHSELAASVMTVWSVAVKACLPSAFDSEPHMALQNPSSLEVCTTLHPQPWALNLEFLVRLAFAQQIFRSNGLTSSGSCRSVEGQMVGVGSLG